MKLSITEVLLAQQPGAQPHHASDHKGIQNVNEDGHPRVHQDLFGRQKRRIRTWVAGWA